MIWYKNNNILEWKLEYKPVIYATVVDVQICAAVENYSTQQRCGVIIVIETQSQFQEKRWVKILIGNLFIAVCLIYMAWEGGMSVREEKTSKVERSVDSRSQ